MFHNAPSWQCHLIPKLCRMDVTDLSSQRHDSQSKMLDIHTKHNPQMDNAPNAQSNASSWLTSSWFVTCWRFLATLSPMCSALPHP